MDFENLLYEKQDRVAILTLNRPQRKNAFNRSMADELKRAPTSVALNLAEADGNRGGNRRIRLETAAGLLVESRTALKVSAAWQYVDG